MTQDQLDLIERYLDGKASPAEASELLETMKTDPSLAHDMEAMASIRTAADEDLAAIQIPDHLYGTIIKDAIATGALGTTAASSTASNLLTSGTTAISMIVSTALVVAVGAWTAIDLFVSAPDLAKQSIASGVPQTGVFQTTPAAENPPSPSALVTSVAPEESADDGSVRLSDPQELSQKARPSVPVLASEPVRTSSHNMAATVTTESRTVNDATSETNIAEVAISRSALLSAERSSIDRTADPVNTAHGSQETIAWSEAPYNSSSTAFPGITVRLLQRPLSGFSFQAQTDQTALGSVALEVDLDVGGGHVVGGGLHRDLFPVDVLQPDGVATTEPFMTWAGAHYRWTAAVSLPLNAQPFVHCAVGGSSRGVVVQPAVGVTIPVDQIRFGIGADVLGLAFQNQGVWGTAFSPALRIELGYNW